MRFSAMFSAMLAGALSARHPLVPAGSEEPASRKEKARNGPHHSSARFVAQDKRDAAKRRNRRRA